ncbi:unnamed protein product [Acanthoscelides obtectus]|uniref:SET domain-containing protein n=1 Tax=Acanthoscelides obtectus TaxID=200917 RepID=A0A9P0K932_ACAOB|nr:unnamed protein product [Acanthoscelides obtectus]CAK1683166.1 SET and MYND domain-containing protein 4 [Acanthoscelides obtectus]
MSDFCDLYPGVSKNCQADQVNLFFEPLAASERSENILYASNSLDLRKSSDRGRKLVAKKTIGKGRILINEIPTVLQVTPLCKCVGERYSLYRCHNCGAAIKLFYVCDGCNICIFCTRSCLFQAYKNYHRYECYGLQRHFWSMDDIDYSYVALRMMLYGASKKFDTQPEEGGMYGNFENNYPFIYALETNFKQLLLPTVNKILYSTARNLVYLIRKTNFFHHLNEDKSCNVKDLHLYVGGLMVKHYCQAQNNNVLLKYPNLTLDFALNVAGGTGKAICPTIALLNHSCSPNAAIIIYSDFVVVKSIRVIRKGEEITICYREVDALLGVDERHIITEEIFHFTCSCSFCMYEKHLAIAPYKCPQCAVGNAQQVESKEGKTVGYCFKCLRSFPLDDIAETFKIATICRNVYNVTYSIEHLARIAECYKVIFHENSLPLLDVYRLLYEKHYHWGEKPVEVVKYGLLLFRILEYNISRLYLPILMAKVKFFSHVIGMKKFTEIKDLNDEEIDIIKTFVGEVVNVKRDLRFYLPADKCHFYPPIQLKVHTMFQRVMFKENDYQAQA